MGQPRVQVVLAGRFDHDFDELAGLQRLAVGDQYAAVDLRRVGGRTRDRAIGISRQPFLGSVAQAMPAIAGINIWEYTGYTALLIFAGLQTVPKEIYEAGAIDGASEMTMFFRITIPLLRPVLVFVLVTTVIGSFQIFDTIAITTKGGPVNATRVIYWYIYEFAFGRFQMGYATAVAVILFLILIAVTFLQMRFLRAGESDI